MTELSRSTSESMVANSGQSRCTCHMLGTPMNCWGIRTTNSGQLLHELDVLTAAPLLAETSIRRLVLDAAGLFYTILLPIMNSSLRTPVSNSNGQTPGRSKAARASGVKAPGTAPLAQNTRA